MLLIEKPDKIAPTIDHALNPDHIVHNTEQYCIAPYQSYARILADLRPELEQQRPLPDLPEPHPNLTHKGNRPPRAVLGNVLGNCI